MATEVITEASKGTVLYEARLFRRKGNLYLYLKSAVLEEHFKAMTGGVVIRSSYDYGGRYDPKTAEPLPLSSSRESGAHYGVSEVLMTDPTGNQAFGYGTVIGKIDPYNSETVNASILPFLTVGIADGVCYRVKDVMLSPDACAAYLQSLKTTMRRYFERSMSRLDMSMTVSTLKEVA